MNKLILLGIAATLGAARLAFFPADPPVELQPTSPGTAQTGHLNISGTATVGLLKSQGTVFGASTATTGFAYGGFFTAASNQGRGFYGYASSPTGLTYGGFFQNASDQGRAVFGLGTATSGLNYGGYFQTASTGGRAVFGVATSGTGTTFGVYGRTNSPNGYGVFSEGNLAATGIISGNGSGLTNLNAANLVGSISLSGSGTLAPIMSTNTNANGRAIEAIVDNTSGFGEAIVGLTNGSGIGVMGDSANSVGSGRGVQGTSNGDTGAGVLGFALHASGVNYGVLGKTNSSNGYGVYSQGNMHSTGTISGNGSGITNVDAAKLGGAAKTEFGQLSIQQTWTASNIFTASLTGIVSTAGGVGIRGRNTSATGTNFGVYGQADSSSGRGVAGYAISTTGATVGVFGHVDSTSGIALFGNAPATSGVTNGVRGSAASPTGFSGFFGGPNNDVVMIQNSGTGRGLRVDAPGDTGVWATTTSGFAGVDGRNANATGYGVYGTNSATTGNAYGVGGFTGSGAGFGVFSFGKLGASGTKSFRIDHPQDPAHRYLMHYSSESPTPQNFYSGNVTTDGQGKAWVTLPGYFAEINANFKYQLTVLDDNESSQFVQVKVGKKIQNNRFLIMSNAPKVEVSWRVEADRNDAWVQRYGAPTEVDKPDEEQGTYQHPELYGFGAEFGVNARRATGSAARKQRTPVPAK